MFQSLRYYWRINLAVVLAAAVATAVLTGALLVGDSVRGSLRALTLDRLGKIDDAVISESLFREKLASEVEGSSQFHTHFTKAVPVFLLRASAIHVDSKRRASRVQISGIDERFLSLFEFSTDAERGQLVQHLAKQPNNVFPSVVINESLAKELGAKAGDQVVFTFQKESYIPSESILGYKDPSEYIRALRLSVSAVLPDQGIGRFGLSSNQNLPFNAFVSLPVLQKAMEQSGRVNSLLVSRKEAEGRTEIENADKEIREILAKTIDMDDLGLLLRESEKYFSLESREVLLKDAVVQLAQATGGEMKLPSEPILTYLANSISGNRRSVPYSTITALNTPVPEWSGFLKWKDGNTVMTLGPTEIALNEWTANDLAVQKGDPVRISYFVAGPGNELVTQEHEFILKGITAMEGIGTDRDLTPQYPGIQDAEHISDWSPPFPVDLSKIRPKDEKYWDQYRAAPKAFISLETGSQLWKNRFGSLTSIRFGPASIGVNEASVDFQKRFLRNIQPEKFGFILQPVKEQGMTAASGSTDFSGLFIGFSFFLIVSAALLVALLFRLSVELRARELGILLSVGYSVKAVRRKFLGEGLLLAVIGSLLGLCAAVAYAWLLLTGLKTWWLAAIGSPFLSLHLRPGSLLIGFLLSLAIVSFSIWRAVIRLAKVPPPLLLSGSLSGFEVFRRKQIWRWIGYFFLSFAILLFVYSFFAERSASAILFFLIGSFLLLTGLLLFSDWLRSPVKNQISGQGSIAVLRMAIRNCVRNPGRSLLSAALVCCACFIIIAVGANRTQTGSETLDRNSGTGGYSLVAESDIAISQDLSTREALNNVGLPRQNSQNTYQIISFRVLPGDDVSCLNLYQPQKPRILGVPDELVRRGGFSFSDSLAVTKEQKENPWLLLKSEIKPGVIPAIGDENSVNWILHLGLGKDMTVSDGFGNQLRLRIVGLLKSSIFQSELLVSASDFLEHFPNQNGYSYFLVETSPQKAAEVEKTLESSLSDFGFDATGTSERLAGYEAVQNTYLSTFQTLGGLGLLLGTLGLGIILVRNVIERRGELATLRAFGYKRSTLALLVLIENGVLLLCGILIGAASALIAVSPHLLQSGSDFPWLSLSLTLCVVFIIGMIASVTATALALRIPLLPALKAE